jgi:hypothetical protein
MRRMSALWEVLVLKFEDALGRYRKRPLTGEEARELLGMSGRLVERYEEDGWRGLRDRRLGNPSPRRAPASEVARLQHEQLQERHGSKLSHGDAACAAGGGSGAQD